MGIVRNKQWYLSSYTGYLVIIVVNVVISKRFMTSKAPFLLIELLTRGEEKNNSANI